MEQVGCVPNNSVVDLLELRIAQNTASLAKRIEDETPHWAKIRDFDAAIFETEVVPADWLNQPAFEFICVIWGKAVSGNHYKKPLKRGGFYVTEEGRAYERLVYDRVYDHAMATGWKIPFYVWLDVELWNQGFDRDNGVKVLNDAMQGVIYSNDARVLDGAIRRKKDDLGPRVVVYAREITRDEAKSYGYIAQPLSYERAVPIDERLAGGRYAQKPKTKRI
jgi:Holliday junction resolvase RusA-like endonuclease